MLGKIYLTLILIFFILAFFIRNIKTFISTKQSIRGRSVKLTLSVLVSGFIYVLILFRLTIFKPVWILELDFSNYLILKYIGFTFVSAGFVLGILALVAMKNSWRVGIRYDQRTDLVTSGIYRFSRNPYFLSYYILIFGYVLIIPSVILFVLYVALAVIFHSLILDEEKYLLSVHRDSYLDYKRKVNRYLTVN